MTWKETASSHVAGFAPESLIYAVDPDQLTQEQEHQLQYVAVWSIKHMGLGINPFQDPWRRSWTDLGDKARAAKAGKPLTSSGAFGVYCRMAPP